MKEKKAKREVKLGKFNNNFDKDDFVSLLKGFLGAAALTVAYYFYDKYIGTPNVVLNNVTWGICLSGLGAFITIGLARAGSIKKLIFGKKYEKKYLPTMTQKYEHLYKFVYNSDKALSDYTMMKKFDKSALKSDLNQALVKAHETKLQKEMLFNVHEKSLKGNEVYFDGKVKNQYKIRNYKYNDDLKLDDLDNETMNDLKLKYKLVEELIIQEGYSILDLTPEIIEILADASVQKVKKVTTKKQLQNTTQQTKETKQENKQEQKKEESKLKFVEVDFDFE